MTLKTRVSVLLVSTPVLAFVVVGGLLGNARAAGGGDQSFQHLRVFQDVMSLVMSNYVEEVKVDRVMEGALRGLADGLDPDSAYLPPPLMRDAEAAAPLADGDVGIELTRQFYLRVIAARDGSPAAQAGLQTGDYVRAIDGKPTREMSVFEGARLLHGQPGTKVTLTVIRGNAADPHELSLVRERPAGPLVSGHMLGDTGYIRISAFRDGVAEELKRQVTTLTGSGAVALIIDIRRTAEGRYDNGIAAARLFVKTGTLVKKAGHDKTVPEETIAARPGDGQFDMRVLLLTTTGTAGAAELFAAALDSNTRAELVGERTLGRAGLQKFVRLPENRGLWLTYARYLTASGAPIQGKGLDADVEVEDPDVEFGAPAPEKDPILEAALARVRDGKS